MRGFVLALIAVAASGCASERDRIGAVAVRTDERGKMQSVFMAKSTGNPKADARFMTFARTTFPSRKPDARPHTTYTYPIVGDPKNSIGDVKVLIP